jgi:hypothetical protein
MAKEKIRIEEEPIFPEESSFIIDGLLEKYGLIKNRGEMVKKIADLLKDPTKTAEEKKQGLENFPGAKLAQLVSDYGYKKISFEKIPSQIEKELNVGQEKSEKIAGELKTTLLDLIKTVKSTNPIKEKEISIVGNKKSERKTKPSIDLPEQKENSFKKDGYREIIE